MMNSILFIEEESAESAESAENLKNLNKFENANCSKVSDVGIQKDRCQTTITKQQTVKKI